MGNFSEISSVLKVYPTPHFTGDYYGIGYQHAKWWFEYLGHNIHSKRFLSKTLKNEFNWSNDYCGLLANTTKFFQNVMLEVHGMHKAFKEFGANKSILDVFAGCIGEFPLNEYACRCTSMAIKKNNKMIIGHNEEEICCGLLGKVGKKRHECPICISKVTIKEENSKFCFYSGSYPLQLLASVFSVSKNLAVQGNSIGCGINSKRIIKNGFECRAPKTFFTRMLAEAESIDNIKQVFSRSLCAVPSHHYIMTDDNIFNIEIRPYVGIKASEQLSISGVDEIHCHANHFVKNGKVDDQWIDKGMEGSSKRRYGAAKNMAEKFLLNDSKINCEKCCDKMKKLKSKEDICNISMAIERISKGFLVRIQRHFDNELTVFKI